VEPDPASTEVAKPMRGAFMGLLRKRGEKFFCHPLLWGALAPLPPLATPLLYIVSLYAKFLPSVHMRSAVFFF